MAIYELENMTSPELRSVIDGGVTTVVIPIGSIEQHGKHMPLGTDAMLSDEIGRQAAERLGAVLAPTVRLGCAAHGVSARSGITPGQSGAHSGEWETSIMLALRPQLVQMNKAEVGYTGDMSEGIRRVYAQRVGIETLSPNGIMGDARLGEAARGERDLERFVAGVVASVERVRHPA
jgi:creatinine amidohydrolase/Fe(II)-dependent formamide hydrolase-like protein